MSRLLFVAERESTISRKFPKIPPKSKIPPPIIDALMKIQRV